MKYCAVPKCTGKGGFSFPRDPELRTKWKIAIKRTTENKKEWEPAKHSVVCQLHFKETDFKEKNSSGFPHQRRFLKEGIIPTLFLSKPHLHDAAKQKGGRGEKSKNSSSGWFKPSMCGEYTFF